MSVASQHGPAETRSSAGAAAARGRADAFWYAAGALGGAVTAVLVVLL